MVGLLGEDVFRLEVVVGDADGMKMLESAKDLGNVEADDD